MVLDEEYYINLISDTFKEKFNRQTALVCTDKNDNYRPPQLKDQAYYYIDFGSEMPQYNPFILFTIGVNPDPNTPDEVSSDSLRVGIELHISTELFKTSDQVLKMISRYRRAMMEVVKCHLSEQIGTVSFVKMPVSIYGKSNFFYYVTGIGIEFPVPL